MTSDSSRARPALRKCCKRFRKRLSQCLSPSVRQITITQIANPSGTCYTCVNISSVNPVTALAVAAAVAISVPTVGSTIAPSSVSLASVSQQLVNAPKSPASTGSITIPEVSGQNAQIVYKKLQNLGLSDVTLASANPQYTMVLNYSNWTCVSIEPSPGTTVNSNDAVVLKVTKP